MNKVLLVICMLGTASLCSATTVPSLGTAASFAALAGGPAAGAVTCTRSTLLTTSILAGDVGVIFPGTFVNSSCTFSGALNTSATVPYADFLTAYGSFPSIPCDQTLTGTLAGVTLSPGVYCFDAAATLTGTLTLNGPADGVWIFKIGTLGTGALTGTNFSVVMTGGAETTCPNVYWWVAQAATMTDSAFQGTILAGADITFTRTTSHGDLLAGGTGSIAVPTGAVTSTDSTITACAPAGGTVVHNTTKFKCNQGVGNGPEGCDPGNSNNHNQTNDESGGTPGNPGRKQ
jgi:hypothetical protein